ncbi:MULTISPECIES: CBS domain-containing protein [unclassified Ekhidna]|jgi:CBS domain-containing protein|uniref:CBS domain-containing protein n=1 Tax=unclassified Ekhidna TaxID=2632188 RepID=UPI0032DF53A1
MKKREKVSNVMTKEVLTINVNNSLKEANALFSKHNIRHIPVVVGENLIGILSKTDILRISFGNTFGDEQSGSDEAIFDMLSINQVMKHSPETVGSEDTLKQAAEILANREFHALPVVDGEKLVGIITTTDIIKYFLEQY